MRVQVATEFAQCGDAVTLAARRRGLGELQASSCFAAARVARAAMEGKPARRGEVPTGGREQDVPGCRLVSFLFSFIF